ncbi:uncharacterized protein LOC118478306 [Aplysia californica]|uniref:Uncharacterized protein LOC118478306 n=1 Tax=Aplysia californica TaxID=6500 RepID=A0ABM1VYU7_APLCA|nr:uncharacterized protein LOC118478306 [Aplysia californica]
MIYRLPLFYFVLSLQQGIIQSIIQRYLYDIQRESEVSGGSVEDVKHSFERLRFDVLSQYQEKDESLAMAMDTVRGVACKLSDTTGRALDYDTPFSGPFPWCADPGNTEDNDSSPLDEYDRYPLSAVAREQEVLFDIHEEAEKYPQEFEENVKLVDESSVSPKDENGDIPFMDESMSSSEGKRIFSVSADKASASETKGGQATGDTPQQNGFFQRF